MTFDDWWKELDLEWATNGRRTLARAAYAAGMEQAARIAHARVVAHSEQGSAGGYDAMTARLEAKFVAEEILAEAQSAKGQG